MCDQINFEPRSIGQMPHGAKCNRPLYERILLMSYELDHNAAGEITLS